MIVLNRKKRIIELLPIGKAKGALNSRRKPLFQGYIRLTRTAKGLRIKRFIIKKGKKEKPTAPAEAIKLLRKQLIFLPKKDDEIEEFLASLNIKNRYARVCNHCLLEGYVTIITKGFKYHNQWICKQCADEVIKREIKYNGMDKKTFKNFKRLLQRTQDLEKLLKVFEPRFDPLREPSLTLFDKTISSKDEKNPISVDELQIPKNFKSILKMHGNRQLLPVQKLAIEEGLLKGEDLLIVSATASGKTLIGELAGIPKALNGKRFLFLTPLVALANQKYHEFKSKYSKMGLKTAIKVGMNRVKARGELVIPDTDIKGADIIVGTYEGIDFILRSDKSNILKELGVVVIDEIHTLDDEERGSRLNGMISRLKKIFPEAQIIALSATIDNP
ncbi:MAG: DEAD/DEAH box helicase, partial [Methanobacteriales archaeon]|nr:DEAD/DEAH box helicase [Methanobacteriales archaeon]